jgi:phage shock protein E
VKTTRIRSLLAVVAAATLLLGACSGGSTATADPVLDTVAPAAAQDFIADGLGDADFVLLDVRTPDEFNEVRLDGAVNLDFYAADFADRLADLDREVTYVVYCNSGNRSGTTLEMMRDLGFTTVHNVDGGITRWYQEGLPLVTE